jgi:hypothetical protein
MTHHTDFRHFIKAPERCKGLKTTTKCSLSPHDHYMLYSISVPETILPGSKAAFFEENNFPAGILSVWPWDLFILTKQGPTY